MNRSPELEAMISAARDAGQGLLDDFARVGELRVVEKGISDFVSSADLRSQELIQRELIGKFPGYGFVAEEDTNTKFAARDACFWVDPLDGTTNFLHGIPHFAVSIALSVQKEPIAAVVFDPAKGEMFSAERNGGAWLGERRLTVSAERTFSRSIFGTGIPHRGRPHHRPYLTALASLLPEVAGVRRLGSAALDLAYVAAGRFEGFFEVGLAPWDTAAGELLVREAGGIITGLDGAPFARDRGEVLASSGEPLHAALMALLSPLHALGSER